MSPAASRSAVCSVAPSPSARPRGSPTRSRSRRPRRAATSAPTISIVSVAVDADEGSVRRVRELRDRAEACAARTSPRATDAPARSRRENPSDRILRTTRSAERPPNTAIDFGRKRRSRLPHQAPTRRNRSRLMMWRWISDVPSQMRSTRASRQKRSSGRSDIRPMPPWIWIASSVTRASISLA